MNFTIEHLEVYLLAIVRMSAFVVSAPYFSIPSVPRKVKAGLSVFLGILAAGTIDYVPLHYVGVIGFAMIVFKEALTGLLIGYVANICTYILSFSGQLIDMEIGFSMVNVLDPVSRLNTTITGNLYNYMVMFMLMITKMHYYILSAIFDSFKLIPIGDALFKENMYEIMVQFMIDYFVIGFRIVLPIFAATLLTNVILGVLARVAPQMNMFVIGIQLKLFVGLFLLFLIAELMPGVADFIFEEMQTMMKLIIKAMTPA